MTKSPKLKISIEQTLDHFIKLRNDHQKSDPIGAMAAESWATDFAQKIANQISSGSVGQPITVPFPTLYELAAGTKMVDDFFKGRPSNFDHLNFDHLNLEEPGWSELELPEEIVIAWRRLPPRERKAMSLRIEHEMTYQQIAKKMHITPGAALTLLGRGYSQLRMALPDVDDEKDKPVSRH